MLRILDFYAKKNHSLFIQWFVDAWKQQGACICPNIVLPDKVRAVLTRMFCFKLTNRRGPLIVCGSHRIETMAWPFSLFYDVIPMMWDLWPGYYDAFEKFVKRYQVKVALCTARQSVEAMRERCPQTRFIWIPEALDVGAYADGGALMERTVDVLAYGRIVGKYTEDIKKIAQALGWHVQFGITSWEFADLRHDVAASKISICFPNCDTNPQKCGNVETLTIRYWEAMLSGTLIVGRAPRELIDVCGYNPVIEAGEDLVATLRGVLGDVSAYQKLADKNRETAFERGGWRDRVEKIKSELGVL